MSKQVFLQLCLILCLTLWCAKNTHAQNTAYLYETVKVTDGDTLQRQNGTFIRLLGINAPEPGTGRRSEEPGGKQASQALKQFLKNQKIRTQGTKKDRYGRQLAHAYLQDGTWLNAWLIQNGYAFVYSFPDNRDYIKELLELETQARNQNKGLWALPRWQIRKAKGCCDTSDIGKFQFIEGKVTNVATVRGTTYLNFGEDWRTDFTVEIPKKHNHLFQNILPKTYQNKTLRVRGPLKPVNGTLITVSHPEQIEILN